MLDIYYLSSSDIDKLEWTSLWEILSMNMIDFLLNL